MGNWGCRQYIALSVSGGLDHPASGRHRHGLVRQLRLDLGKPALRLLSQLEQIDI